MTHKIVELASVGSQWETKRSGTFFGNRTFTIVRHDMNERRIRYVYNGDTQEMSKSFDTFERELRQGNIRVVDVAPKAATCRFRAGQFWESIRSECPLKLGVRFEIVLVEGGKVYYRYDSDPAASYRSLLEMERYFDSEWIIPAPVPAKKPEPMGVKAALTPQGKHWENPFAATAGETLLAMDYKSIEQRVMANMATTASVPARIQELLREYQGRKMTSTLAQRLNQEIQMVIPVGISHNLIFDADGQNLRVELEGPVEHYQIDTHSVKMHQKGSSSQKEVLDERLKAALRATEHRVTELAISIGDHKLEIPEGKMFIRDNPEITLKTNMEKPMTRIVNVFLMDKTAGLKAAERMIGKVENFASDATDNTTLLLELSMEHDLKGMLHDHNKRRKAIINQDILNRVGKTVYLQPIELKDVKIDVQVVTAV